MSKGSEQRITPKTKKTKENQRIKEESIMSTLVLKNKGTMRDYVKENSVISAGQEKVIMNASILGSLVFALIVLAQVF